MRVENQEAIEKLGAFYLGRLRDTETGERLEDPLLYDSRDLTTHGVIVGMTGSGKTGLALAALEEAALDGIPVIAIDPKGDLGNLQLTFPDLAPEDFRPWINEEVARQRGQEPDEHAAEQAELWRNGLEGWDQDGDRIRRLRERADFAVYTPGSATGRPVSVLRSFAVPSAAVLADPDALRERIQTTATSLLALIGIQADPIRSREHILLSSILQNAWEHGRSLELGQLIEAVQRPPFSRVGVMELESFFPSKDRFDLALRINGILASPGFQAWLEGDPLDIPRFLHAPDGRPRVSIFSIAHLSDEEQMFFVAMLLNEVLSWMRGQSGTSSLRALLYMDEIFGFFPPSANPPSKLPMLTMLKQARAYGLGVLLATQNPVDLDYKGLGNTGSWFIGRLQTERDKARIMDALQGATAGATPMPRAELDRLISGLGQRVFLLHNVHDDGPVLFETRWVMSYMAGPMTLAQLRQLDGRGAEEAAAGTEAAPPPPEPVVEEPQPAADPPASPRPLLPPGVSEHFLAPLRGSSGLRYEPAVAVFADVAYRSARAGVDKSTTARVVVPLSTGSTTVDWERTEAVDLEPDHLENEPLDAAAFGELPADALQPRSYDRWGRDAARWIQANIPVTLLESDSPKAISNPGETEAEFRARLADMRREARDAETDRIRRRYESRLQTLQNRELRAVQNLQRRSDQAQQRSLDTALRIGEGLLGAFLGRKTTASRAGTAVRSAGRVAQQRQEVARAEETVEQVREEIRRMEEEFRDEVRKVELNHDGEAPLEELHVRATLTNINVRLSTLVWAPVDAEGRELWR